MSGFADRTFTDQNFTSAGFTVPWGGEILAPSLDINFLTGSLDPRITFTRLSSARYFNSTGTLVTVGNDIPRFDYDLATLQPKGLLIEEARMNVVLWNRDLTNAAWTKSNVTAAKDQIGIDGAANSASSITATAGNGTCLQAITLASSARFQSAYVKRLTGSGTIQMTMDNGSTWTTVTVTAAWTLVTIPTQTLANPTVGFRIVTSGDAIAVDYVQNENGLFATSPMLVTTVAAGRALDSALITGTNFSTWYNQSEGTMYAEATAPIAVPSSSYGIFGVSDNSSNNRNILRKGNAIASMITVTGGAVQATPSPANAWNDVNFHKVAYAYKVNSFVGALDGTLGTVDTAGTVPTVTQAEIGFAQGGLLLSGNIKRIKYWPARLSNSTLQQITT